MSDSKAAVAYNMPEEIIREILMWLPPKSLTKFMAVCKSWSSMIKDSNFIYTHLHRGNQYRHQNKILNLLLVNDYVNYGSYRIKESINMYTPLIYPSDLLTPRRSRGTCNGLFLLSSDHRQDDLIIWNPSVRKIVRLPPYLADSAITKLEYTHAFGYDARTNDYKVLTIFEADAAPEVYSLASHSWKRLGDSGFPTCSHFASAVWLQKPPLVKNAMHWVINPKEAIPLIVSFDMASEIFSEILIPKGLRDTLPQLTIYEESLALIDICMFSQDLHIWVMKEYGVAKSWTSMIKISIESLQLEFYPSIFKKQFDPSVLDWNGEDMILYSYKRKVYTLNYKAKQLEYIGVIRENYSPRAIFVESIVLLGQSNAIGYTSRV